MLKLFVASAQLALPLCLLSAMLIANRSYAPTKRQRVGRLTVVSLGAGFAVAVVIVWLRLNTQHIRLPVINIWTGSFLVVAQFAFLAALWMMGKRPLVSDSPNWRHRVLTGTSLAALLFVNVFYGIPLYLAIDGVVPMNGSLFASDSLVNLIGFILGVAVTAFAGWLAATSLGRIPALPRRIVTTLVMTIAIVCQWAPLYQQYAAVKFVPKSSLNFDVLLWVQRNSVPILLAYTVLAVTPAVIALVTRRPAVPPDAVPAQKRLVKADVISRRRFFGLSAAVGVGLATTFTIGKTLAEAVPELSPIEPSVVNGEHVEVDLATVSDGHLHRFAYVTPGGTEVRFIVIQKNSVAFGTGLDACEICGPSGYFERDGKVVCRKCDVVMNIQTIGFAGGCNPIPISYELTTNALLFKVAELQKQAKVFG